MVGVRNINLTHLLTDKTANYDYFSFELGSFYSALAGQIVWQSNSFHGGIPAEGKLNMTSGLKSNTHNTYGTRCSRHLFLRKF